MKIKFGAIVVAIVSMIVGCKSPTSPIPYSNTGKVEIFLLDLVSSQSPSNTLHEAYTYSIQGLGPLGEIVETTLVGQTSLSLSELSVGGWSFSGRSTTTNGVVLAKGQLKVTVKSGRGTRVTMHFETPSSSSNMTDESEELPEVTSERNFLTVKGQAETKGEDDALPLSMSYDGPYQNVQYCWSLDERIVSYGRTWVATAELALGIHRIDAAVVDIGGKTIARSTFSLSVVSRSAILPPGGASASGATFDVTATQALFDRRNRRLWFIDQQRMTVSVVSLASRLVERRWIYRKKPAAICLSSDQKQVYVAFQDREHSYTWWESDQTGAIGVYDADSVQSIRTFKTSVDPCDLVALSSGLVAVASGSGQWTSIHFYDPMTGVLVRKKTSYYYGGTLFADPDGHTVHYQDSLMQFNSIESFPDAQGFGVPSSSVRGLHRSRCLEAGPFFLGESGVGFDLKTQSTFSLVYSPGTMFVAAAYSRTNSTLFAVTSENEIVSCRPNSNDSSRTVAFLERRPSFLFTESENLFALDFTATGVELVPIRPQ